MWIKKIVNGKIVLGIAVLSLLVVFPGTAEAATITVSTTSDVVADDGQCSLREAITAANTDSASGPTGGECPAGSGADTITLPAGTYTLTLGSQLTINQDLTLSGAGADTTIIQAATAPLTATYRVLFIDIVGGNVDISGVTIRHGDTNTGGGIRNDQAIVTLNNTAISDNDGGNAGGGIYNFAGTLTVSNSTISGNTAINDGGIENLFGTLSVVNSTFSGNAASVSGGGLLNDGVATIINATFTDNRANFSNPTFAGGGLRNGNDASINIVNTIIAGNPVGNDCAEEISSLGNNLDSDNTCNLTDSTDLPSATLLLGPLQDNGGPTFTHALLTGSPAIDAGDTSAAPSTDQRGTTRPQGAASDIGAFEFVSGAAIPSLSQWGLIAMAILLVVVFGWRLPRLAGRERA